ncbi:hypothetical protein COU57_00155 [Candidatus Pacearchaeota archaeon CG10_big_fil_rev_8_21_14_0_10_32_14]|nr:MAG: hypothetical protein COU57_00155 [Candidatus Pacearchaeota archaeon CG10_big_fil_rev_8_21_14_0_10_32_14]
MWKNKPPHEVKESDDASVVSIQHYPDDNFIIVVKPKRKWSFKAGQFAILHVNKQQRPFSIASPPSQRDLTFLVKKHDQGIVTPTLTRLKVGDTIEVSGPYGAYTYKPRSEKNIIFISSGTGVAPFHSMIPDILEKYKDKKVTLIHGFRFDCFFDDTWRALVKKYKNFKPYGACSRPVQGYKGLQGHVTDHICSLITSPKDSVVYICGSEAMVEETKKILLNSCGFKENQIRVEEWRDNYRKISKEDAITKQNTQREETKNNPPTQRKLNIGWFSFSCCEDSTIIFTELLNDHFDDWSKVINFQHVRVLKSKNKLEDLDVAFIEGAISSADEAFKVKEIRENSKKVVAIGSCACTGMPSAQRNDFNSKQKAQIEELMKKFHHARKVEKLEEVIKVDAKVNGCPMNEQVFLNVVNDTLREFGILPKNLEEKK